MGSSIEEELLCIRQEVPYNANLHVTLALLSIYLLLLYTLQEVDEAYRKDA